MKLQTIGETITSAFLQDIHKAHVGSIKIGQKVNYTTREEHPEVEFSDQSALFCWSPIINNSDMFDIMLTDV
jgi:hypothetical protein